MVKPQWQFTQFIWWMETEYQVAINPRNKPTDLACESTSRLLLSTSAIAI